MSNLNYYADVKVIKKPLKQRLKGFFKFFLIICVIVGCFVGAKYLSAALTVGNLGSLIVYGDTSLKLDESTMYAVTLGEYDNKEEAERVALGSNIQGAGGFVWEDKKYYVIGNVYTSENDALNVKENLKDTKYSVGIKNIIFPKLKLDFSMYENSDMGIIKKSINIFDEVYKMLYDNSILFDKGEVSHLAVSSRISEVRGDLKSVIINIQNLLNKESSKLKNIQSSLIKLDELLDQTIIKTIDNTSTNYSIKYAIVSVVRLKYELFNSLT